MSRADGQFKRGHKPLFRTKQGYGRAGRPVLDKPRSGPACETCRNLRTGAKGDLTCACGRILDPVNCNDFKDCSDERVVIFGGITGITAR